MIVTLNLFLQNVKQACDIYGKMEKIIVIGDETAPGSRAMSGGNVVFAMGYFLKDQKSVYS